MRRLTLLAAIAVLVAAAPSSGLAFSIGTPLTAPCHERMTRKAVERSNVDKPDGWLREWPEQDATWIKVARWLEEQGLIEAKNDDRWRLLMVSLFLGARYPDQRGFGNTDLQGLREVHLSEADQFVHSLRNPEQDGPDGDRLALESTRSFIRELVLQARSPIDPWSMAGHMKTVSVWVEFYGQVDVTVWGPAFDVARALHTMQDSFSHTYRSADLSRVYAVANYLDAISGNHDEARDGPRHSKATDDCDGAEIEPLKDAAVLASTDLFNAGLDYMNTGDMAAVDQVIDRWLTLEPGCGYSGGYCSTPWAAVARRDETAAFGCSVASAGAPSELQALALAIVFGLLRRRGAAPRRG